MILQGVPNGGILLRKVQLSDMNREQGVLFMYTVEWNAALIYFEVQTKEDDSRRLPHTSSSSESLFGRFGLSKTLKSNTVHKINNI